MSWDQVPLYTVTKRLVLAALFAISAGAAASSSNQPPRFLTVPALGLRLPFDRIKLDLFPDELRAACDEIADNEHATGRMWIFGRAKDATSTYVVVTGYFKRRSPDPKLRLYDILDDGAVFTIRGQKCSGDPEKSEILNASGTLNMRDPEGASTGNVPIPILRELARDLAAQTVRASGGPDQLRAAIIAQHIDFNILSPELQEAFRPYFPAASW